MARGLCACLLLTTVCGCASRSIGGVRRSDAGAARDARAGAPDVGHRMQNSDGGMEPCQQVNVESFVPAAARFAPGSTVSVAARLQAGAEQACRVELTLSVHELTNVVFREQQLLTLEPGAPTDVAFAWTAPAEDYRGYMAVLRATSTAATASTGVDVSSDPTRYPRYGYISVFPPEQSVERSRELVRTLSGNYHLNLLQLYDWSWRHEDLIPRQANGSVQQTWEDLFGRVISWNTVLDVVQASHEQNVAAMAYVAMYAAREGYEQNSGVSPAWGLYTTATAEAQVALSFGAERFLFLFDPSNTNWQDLMAAQYVEAMNAAGFDGVHIDQFGPRPTTYRADGTPVELNETFAPFLEAVDRALPETGTRGLPSICAFNIVDGIVGGYGVEQVATSPACDLLYSEIWFANDTYESLRDYIEELRRIGGGRAVVLAVYPQYGEDVGVMLEAESADLDGVSVSSDHHGFSGNGYVDNFDAVGDAVGWTVQLDEESLVSLVFTYANPFGAPASRSVVVDGATVGRVSFPANSESPWLFDAWLQVRLSAGTHSVQLAYAEGDAGRVLVDRMTLGEFDEASVRLQNAVIFASGATPILIGDDEQSLAHEYFPNRSKSLRPSLKRALQSQYSFITAHERLLFAPDVTPTTDRLGSIEALSAHRLIDSGSNGIWVLPRHTPLGDVIHLVNLRGVDDARWRNAAPTPVPAQNIRLRYRTPDARNITQVAWATPDSATGELAALPFIATDDSIEFELPRLQYWDLVLLQRGAEAER